jgi:hypothetical protein
MTAHLASLKDTQDGVLNVMWFQIDKYTRGPVLIYASEQNYISATAARNENRKNSGVTMFSEQKGSTIAVMSKL